MFDCEDFTIDIRKLPQKLNMLGLAVALQDSVIEELPPEINLLKLNCHNLISINTLPSFLEKLSLANCDNLEIVKAFPKLLREIDLVGCGKLKDRDNLLKSLHPFCKIEK